MKRQHGNFFAAIVVSCAAASGLGGCGGDSGETSVAPVTIDAGTPNTVSRWDEIAATTLNQSNMPTGTPEEMQSIYAVDLATVHIAMYDAVNAIDGRYAAFTVTPTSPAAGASQDAAATAAAYGVLKGLFPTRTAQYQGAYDDMIAAIADGTAKTQGIALGAEVAAKVLASRADDGRAVTLAPFVAGAGPGQFRGPAIVGRAYPFVRPFALTSAMQFRAPDPLALTSAAYAADVNETEALGGSTSTTRTDAQSVSARFHTEAPFLLWPRNLRPFMMTPRSLADQARLGALMWVAHADATIACFDSKYHFLFWRPNSAINFADTDGNDATTAAPGWTSFQATPPHPEYPAAHACAGAATAEALRSFFGTSEVSYDFTSTVTGTSHHYDSTDALLDDITIARIAGGMHFRNSIGVGMTLGKNVAQYIVQTKFLPR